MDGLAHPAEKLLQPFSFVWLEERIAEYAQDAGGAVITRFELYGVFGVVAFGGVGILAALLLRNQVGLLIAQASAILLWVFAALICVRTSYLALRNYKHQHVDFARDLDGFYVRYRNIIDALRTHPASEVARHLRYIRDRKAMFIYRHTLLSGSMEKIGILPLLVVLYLQIKDWSFGDWKGLLDHPHLIGNALLWVLLITYCLAWWGARAKGRLDVYEALLTEAGVVEVERGGCSE